MGDRAQELMDKGDKKLKKFFGGSQKYEDARELYLQAANQYKKVQNWEGAANAFMRCYAMDQKTKCETDKTSDLLDAANAYRKFDLPKASEVMGMAQQLLDAAGRYDRAAKLCVENAKIYEEKLINEEPAGHDRDVVYEEIVNWYSKARDYYRLMKNSATHCNECISKIAGINVLQGNYQEALDQYEELGKHCAEDNLLRFNAKGYFFTALLCQLPLINDDTYSIDPFRAKFEEYCDIDLQFCENTHEYIFCKAIIQAFESDDLDVFSEGYRKFDRIIPFDKPKEIMVMKGRQILVKKVDDQR